MAQEVQTSVPDWVWQIGGTSNLRAGQRLTISGREVSALSFYLVKNGLPSGNLTFTIRKVSDDSIILSKLWGNASAIGTIGDWYEVTFTTPATINEEVRILAEYGDGAGLFVGGNLTDVKASEYDTRYTISYSDDSGADIGYKYIYTGFIPKVFIL